MPHPTTPDATTSEATTPDATTPEATTPEATMAGPSVSEPVVRPAGSGDVARLLEIHAATHSTRSSPGPGAQGDSDGVREDLDDTLVGEVDGVVQGMVLLGSPTPLPSNQHVQMIRGLDVHPDAQGRGLGGRLLDAAIVAARERGATRLTLRVLGHNDVARRLYERVGFVVEGVLRGEFVLDGEEVDDVVMARRLDDGETDPH